jgi:predicted PurR-regulated permease PerM
MLTLTVLAAIIAIALNHLVHVVQRRHVRHGWAIVLVLAGATLLLGGVLVLIIPATLKQGHALADAAPSLLADLRKSRVFGAVDSQFGLEKVVKDVVTKPSGPGETGPSAVVGAIGGIVSAVAGAATLAALTIFMLIFGPGLVKLFFEHFSPPVRDRWQRVAARSYSSVGGYLGGLMVICSINAIVTTSCLALLHLPFFLPLGILSGFASTVPYAGPVAVAAVVTLVTLLSSGAAKAGIVLAYFVLYGQFEGNVLGPFVFRRSVHLDPLVTLLSILLLAEFMGIGGAILAVPAVAVGQVVLRDLLSDRLERHREPTHSPP